jgi:hypothetical protein
LKYYELACKYAPESPMIQFKRIRYLVSMDRIDVCPHHSSVNKEKADGYRKRYQHWNHYQNKLQTRPTSFSYLVNVISVLEIPSSLQSLLRLLGSYNRSWKVPSRLLLSMMERKGMRMMKSSVWACCIYSRTF